MGATLKVVQTKRFMYDVLLARLHALDVYASKSNDVYEDSCIAILGVRQIGKTVLLKQLHNAAPDISEYRDCSKLSESFDFEDVGLSIILDTIIKKFDRRKPFEGTHRTVVCST